MKIEIVAKVLGFIAYVVIMPLTLICGAAMWQGILAGAIFGFFVMVLMSEVD